MERLLWLFRRVENGKGNEYLGMSPESITFAEKYSDSFMCRFVATLILCVIHIFALDDLLAQELNCTVKVNHAQIQGTSTGVFETLERKVSDFMNESSWTDLQFQKTERIECTMTITVKKYDEGSGSFNCELMYQVSRPVFNSAYSTIVFSMRDPDFNFNFREQDNLEFNINNLDNNLTAMLGYYAYLFIGMDLDTFSPLGGTEVLQMVVNIANNAQSSMGDSGWKAFGEERNRYAIINDYMESSMEALRQMQYKYCRNGLDEMAQNADRGRAAVTEALELLKEAHEGKPLSELPLLFTDFKRDEIVNIYSGHGTEKERQRVYDIVSDLNASQSSYWAKIKK